MEFIFAELRFVFKVMTVVSAAMILFRLFSPVIRRKNKDSERLALTYRIYLVMGAGSLLVTIISPLIYIGMILLECRADGVTAQNYVNQYVLAVHGSMEILLFTLIAIVWCIGFVRTFLGTEIRRQEEGYRKISSFSVPVSDRHTLSVYENCLANMKLSDSPILMTNLAASSPFLAKASGEPVQCLILKEIPPDDTELTICLVHELVHFRRKDLKIRKFAAFTGAVYWYVGAQDMFDHQIRLLQESLCDMEAMKVLTAMADGRNCSAEQYFGYIIDLAAGKPAGFRPDKQKVTLEERIIDVIRNLNSMSSATSSGSVSVPAAAVIVLIMTLGLALFHTPVLNEAGYFADMVTVSAKASSQPVSAEARDTSRTEVITVTDDYSEVTVPAGQSIVVKSVENSGENDIIAVDAYSDSGKFRAGYTKDGQTLFAESDKDGCLSLYEDGASLGTELILENSGDCGITVCLYLLYETGKTS